MIDIKLLRTDPDMVRENIKKKFQDEKLPLVDEVIALDKEYREAVTRCDYLRNQRNVISKRIGMLMHEGTVCQAVFIHFAQSPQTGMRGSCAVSRATV